MFKFIKNKKKDAIDYDSSYFKEENFKKNVFLGSFIIFFIIFIAITYAFIRDNIITFSTSTEDKERPALKIVVPYPNNSLNIDDYEIFRYQIKNGDNLSKILIDDIGVTNTDAKNILSTLKKVLNPSQIKVGQIINIKYKTIISQNQSDEIEEKIIIEELKIETIDKETEIIVSLNKNNNYSVTQNKISYTKNLLKYRVVIAESLYNDGLKAGIPANIMVEFIKFFSFDIDFQRDLRKNDEFEILFETYSTKEGKKIKNGDILYASITNKNKKIEMYKYTINGINTYFNKDGQGIQKSLLKTPINGARVSSNYGLRRHPILGYTKMHKGKDFAAPIGTPIFAAGTGTVEIAKFWSTWGNYIKIKHAEGYATEYAHASKIANGIKPGVRVKQGQVIAYVGSTGRSTGPHLHFGVFYKGERINPDRVKSFPSIKLIGKDLISFKKEVEKIDFYRNSIPNQNIILKK